ncbi:uncharacterized protein LOC109911911 [Rhincodon typus]|uniref:uncharacterized protein LOC109911911 n=1 Tax=Rhincodon typus TaxID=259920 RepID=UPI00202E087D|nr:uncharacterized protein LOC109911911 [Rhincodon typus]
MTLFDDMQKILAKPYMCSAMDLLAQSSLRYAAGTKVTTLRRNLAFTSALTTMSLRCIMSMQMLPMLPVFRLLNLVTTIPQGFLFLNVNGKIADDGVGLTGILRKDFRENIVRKYLGFNRSVELASDMLFSLLIHNVTSEDFGKYQCSMWAPLGTRNRQADVHLREVGILQSKRFGQQPTILPVVLIILGSTLLIFVVFLSIACARNHKMALDCKKFNKVQATQCSWESC